LSLGEIKSQPLVFLSSPSLDLKNTEIEIELSTSVRMKGRRPPTLNSTLLGGGIRTESWTKFSIMKVLSCCSWYFESLEK